jgi:hypothetical protein
MRISPRDLTAEYVRAKATWPFVTEVNDAHGMPRHLLYAVGSRETNLRNVVGDGGHGHGVFQLDDRSHQIPPGFDQDVRAQAEKAGQMLEAGFHRFGDWVKSCNYYNSGSPNTGNTTGRDYGPDVMERQAYLATLDNGPPDMRFSTWGTDVRTHRAPSTSSPVVHTFPGPTIVILVCQTHAEAVTAEGYTNDAWSQLPDGSWITNIYIQGGAWLEGVPTCSDLSAKSVVTNESKGPPESGPGGSLANREDNPKTGQRRD